MDMVVMQARDNGRARDVEDLLALARRQLTDLDDLLVDTDVGGGAVEQRGALNQHDANRLSASSRSTAALSAPSAGALEAMAGVAAQLVSAVR
ncbi:MAG TPA: hypothetical protein VHJ79_15665, partial [Mycobacterium sp.]|nr:hypothetical protein [Mycobacterium sp.]